MRAGRGRQFAPDNGCTEGGEILVCQGHGTPLTGRGGAMVACQSGIPHDNFAACQRHSAHVHSGLTLIRREDHCSALRCVRNIQHARQVFPSALHQETVEINPYQLGMKITAPSDDPVDALSSDGRTVGIGVGNVQTVLEAIYTLASWFQISIR
jgi:hypothetical protein